MKFLLIIVILLTYKSYAKDNYEFLGEKSLKIVYTKYGVKKGSRGSIAISTGRTESSLKYEDIARKLRDKGYSPIYVLNHRGQGFSDRALRDSHKGYVERFNYYYKDFNKFVKAILRDPDTDTKKLYLLAHSMGGAIATGYLQSYVHPFKKVALTSPMLGIKLEKGEVLTLAQTALSCYTPFGPGCTDYVPGGGPFSFDKVDFENNKLTNNEKLYHKIFDSWSVYPELQLGSATIKWIRESVKANRKMRSTSNLRKIRNVKILLLQAGQEKIVENKMQDVVCSRINTLKKGQCKKHVYENAMHEILIEKEDIQNDAINRISNFFSVK